MKNLFALLCLALAATGCATNIEGHRYNSIEPAFELFEFFDGSIKAWGLVQNSSGEIEQRFEVDIVGTVNGDRLTLNEKFKYSIGEGPGERIWVIQKLGNGYYNGTANDTVGKAKGMSFGNAFNWTYRMEIPVGADTFEVVFKDWFWAIDQNRLFNRSYIQKFGLNMAEVSIFMERQ